MAVGKGYSVDEDDRFRGFLKTLQKEADDTSFVMNEAARIIGKFTRRNFQLKGSGQYQKLAPVADGDPVTTSNYAARKLRKHGFKPILVVSGKLKRTASNLRGGSGAIREIGKASLVYGTSLPYAAPLQEGAKFKKRKGGIPARPFLFLDKMIVNSIMKTYEGWLEAKLAA